MRVLRALAAAAVVCVTTAPSAHAWVDPTTGAPSARHVTKSAEIPRQNWLPGHRGVDLGMEPGAEVRSSGPGVVAFAGTVAGVPAVSIDHPGGIRTTYQPVHPRVETGTIVEEGQVIGMLGHSPEHDGLHWGARTGPDSYINPLTLLAAPTIRLKPVGAAR